MPGLTIDEFRQRVEATKIKCELCSFRAHSLVEHLRYAHQLTPGQYRKQTKNGKFCSPLVTETLRRIGREAQATDKFENFTAAFDVRADHTVLFAEAKSRLPVCSKNLKDKIPDRVESFFFGEKETKGVLTGLVLGKNIFIEGPTGCGKTELVLQVHSMMGLPIQRVNMNGDATVANFIGSMRATQEDGTFYHYGMLPEAMKNGHTLLVDEIDYTPPHIAAVMNSVLEGKRVLYLEDTNETIVAKEGFNVIATGNTGGKGDSTGVYTGTEILNTAFLDRFAIKLKMDYLPRSTERGMLIARFPDEPIKNIELLLSAAEEIRQAFQQGNLGITFSTRKLIDYFELTQGMDVLDALEMVLLNWLDADDRVLVEEVLRRVGLAV